jgi:RNA polymerase-binding transcription factor DksA
MTEPGTSAAVIRARLTADLVGARARIAALTRDFDGVVAASQANDDEHDPEGATNAFERQHIAALLAQARHQLDDISAALRRLDDGRYGICERCGGPVGADRLRARPAARTCITCAAASRPG